MSQSPMKPWQPGVYPTYTAFRLTVNICQDEFGNVWSDHEFSTPEDQVVASALAHGGVHQVAHALLTEAVRREVFTSALILMSRDSQFLGQWQAADSTGRNVREEELVRAALCVVTQTAEKMMPSAVAGVLTMLGQQGGASRHPPE